MEKTLLCIWDIVDRMENLRTNFYLGRCDSAPRVRRPRTNLVDEHRLVCPCSRRIPPNHVEGESKGQSVPRHTRFSTGNNWEKLVGPTERYPTKYTRSAKVQISSWLNDVTDVICTLLFCKYPSIDAVYEYSVPWWAGPELRKWKKTVKTVKPVRRWRRLCSPVQPMKAPELEKRGQQWMWLDESHGDLGDLCSSDQSSFRNNNIRQELSRPKDD